MSSSVVPLESDDHDRDRDNDDDDDDDDDNDDRRRRHGNVHTAVALEEPDDDVVAPATRAIHDGADHIDDVNALPSSNASDRDRNATSAAGAADAAGVAAARRVTSETSASFVKRLAFQFVLLLAAGVFYMLMFAGPGIGFGADVSLPSVFFFFFSCVIFFFFLFFRS